MTEPTPYLSDWWRWWSNPLINMHPSQRQALPFTEVQLEELNYLMFLELRSILSLSDKPDNHLEEQPQLRSFGLGNLNQLSAETIKIAVLGLDSKILHANAQQWKKNYGIESAEDVRSIIQMWNQIPHKLKAWQESLLLEINATPEAALDLQKRALLVLGAYVMSFYPDFYTRWALTLPLDIALTLKSIDPIPQECKHAMNDWLEASLNALHQQVLARYPSEDLDVDVEEDDKELEALSELIDLERFDDA